MEKLNRINARKLLGKVDKYFAKRSNYCSCVYFERNQNQASDGLQNKILIRVDNVPEALGVRDFLEGILFQLTEAASKCEPEIDLAASDIEIRGLMCRLAGEEYKREPLAGLIKTGVIERKTLSERAKAVLHSDADLVYNSGITNPLYGYLDIEVVTFKRFIQKAKARLEDANKSDEYSVSVGRLGENTVLNVTSRNLSVAHGVLDRLGFLNVSERDNFLANTIFSSFKEAGFNREISNGDVAIDGHRMADLKLMRYAYNRANYGIPVGEPGLDGWLKSR